MNCIRMKEDKSLSSFLDDFDLMILIKILKLNIENIIA